MSDAHNPGGQPPYGNQPPYGGQPPYGDQPPYGGQPAYGDQPAYGGQPTYGGQPPYGDPAGSSAGQYSGYPTPEGPGGSSGKGFFGALFDFSFSSFVTPMIVKFVYVLATVLLALGTLIIIVAAFNDSAALGVVMLIVAPIFFLIYLAFIRMTLEFYFALVRMSQDIHNRLPPR